MSSVDSPSVRERRLARDLREVRIGAEMAGNAVAEALGWSASKVSRIETGRIGISPGDLDLLIELYRVPIEQAEYLRRLAPTAAPAGGGTRTPIRCPRDTQGCCGWKPGRRHCAAIARCCHIRC